jgi:hypothetical protein
MLELVELVELLRPQSHPNIAIHYSLNFMLQFNRHD